MSIINRTFTRKATGRQLLRITRVERVNAIRPDLALEAGRHGTIRVTACSSKMGCLRRRLSSDLLLRALDTARDEVEGCRTVGCGWVDRRRCVLRWVRT